MSKSLFRKLRHDHVSTRQSLCVPNARSVFRHQVVRGAKFRFALKDENLPIRKRLFLTATPRHYDLQRRDAEGEPVEVYAMNRPEIYGSVVHTLSFAEAARQKIICNYKVIISVVTSDMLPPSVLAPVARGLLHYERNQHRVIPGEPEGVSPRTIRISRTIRQPVRGLTPIGSPVRLLGTISSTRCVTARC